MKIIRSGKSLKEIDGGKSLREKIRTEWRREIAPSSDRLLAWKNKNLLIDLDEHPEAINNFLQFSPVDFRYINELYAFDVNDAGFLTTFCFSQSIAIKMFISIKDTHLGIILMANVLSRTERKDEEI